MSVYVEVGPGGGLSLEQGPHQGFLVLGKGPGTLQKLWANAEEMSMHLVKHHNFLRLSKLKKH